MKVFITGKSLCRILECRTYTDLSTFALFTPAAHVKLLSVRGAPNTWSEDHIMSSCSFRTGSTSTAVVLREFLQCARYGEMVATRTSAALGLSGSAPFSVFLKFKPMDSARTEFLDRFS